MACYMQQVQVLWEVDILIHSVSTYRFCQIIDPVIMREVWSLEENNKVFCNNLRIVRI